MQYRVRLLLLEMGSGKLWAHLPGAWCMLETQVCNLSGNVCAEQAAILCQQSSQLCICPACCIWKESLSGLQPAAPMCAAPKHLEAGHLHDILATIGQKGRVCIHAMLPQMQQTACSQISRSM